MIIWALFTSSSYSNFLIVRAYWLCTNFWICSGTHEIITLFASTIWKNSFIHKAINKGTIGHVFSWHLIIRTQSASSTEINFFSLWNTCRHSTLIVIVCLLVVGAKLAPIPRNKDFISSAIHACSIPIIHLSITTNWFFTCKGIFSWILIIWTILALSISIYRLSFITCWNKAFHFVFRANIVIWAYLTRSFNCINFIIFTCWFGTSVKTLHVFIILTFFTEPARH